MQNMKLKRFSKGSIFCDAMTAKKRMFVNPNVKPNLRACLCVGLPLGLSPALHTSHFR